MADYYSQMRKTGKWQIMPGKVKHVKELFELFNALTSDKRFIDMYTQRKEEQNDMASIALDYLEDEYKKVWLAAGRAEGHAEGEKSGISKGKTSAREESALAMLADHLPVEKVAKYSKLTLKKATALGKKHGYL